MSDKKYHQALTANRKLLEENARLKAQVERLAKELSDEKSANANVEARQNSANRGLSMDNFNLKAEVENSKRINTELLVLSNRQASDIRRLTKAGDELWEFAKLADTNAPKARRKALKDWNAAKEGKQP